MEITRLLASFITISFVASLLVSCDLSKPPSASTIADRFYVSGYITAPVSSGSEKIIDIALPHASVFIYQDLSQKPLASTLSDLSGRFKLMVKKPGTYFICVEADGFDRYCEDNRNLSTPYTNINPLRIAKKRSENRDRATIFGSVSLADGSVPRGFEPLLGVNAYAKITMETNSGIEYKGFVNNFGEYIIPSAPVKEDFTIQVAIDKELKKLHIRKETLLNPNVDHKINIQLDNRPPKVHLLSASIAGEAIQVAPLGSTVTLTASSSDLNTDGLIYRWSLSDGTVAGPSSSPTLDWDLPNKKGMYTARAIVSDDRGGYVSQSTTVEVGDNRVTFSGEVVDTEGNPIGQVQIDINGRLLNTDIKGRFTIRVPVAKRYIMNLRKNGVEQANSPAYGTASFVYTGAIHGGKWVLRRAQLFTVDPTKPINISHKRDKRDCVKPKPYRINWSKHLHTGLFQWQDGRGYARSIAEIGQTKPESSQKVMKLLSRINENLPMVFAKLSKQREYKHAEELPCLDGIGVSIPANSLIDPVTGLAPTGDVQIALSTISLNQAQMPGDFSADNGTGVALGMESFGAGSVEIGSGGKRYNLKPGTSSEVTIPVDATQVFGGAALQNEVPFLYYNEQTGVWKQEGVTKLINTPAGPAYSRKVNHFSTLNADILKSGQSCVAVEVDPAAGFTLPLDVEVTLQPSVVNPNVIQVRTLVVDSQKSNVIYNLPNGSDIVLTPIIEGEKADGSTGPVPAGVFVVNTGGPQTSAGNVPVQNPDGTYYSEDGSGTPTGPCASRVTLTNLALPTPSAAEFLQGLSFQSSNITEFEAIDTTVSDNIIQGAQDYYDQVDPRNKRASFNLFISENKFGQPLDVANGEVEWDAQFANSGDLGFGRDMHCRRNFASDGQFDVACYVTNYGQPPADFADQVDADNALSNTNPDATVTMEFSRVENPLADPIEFPDNDRAVKFFVYGANPDAEPLTKADLDGVGERPIPQLCMVCHGGNLTSQAADPLDPTGPKKGAFTDRADIMAMNSSFLPFDLNLYNFPALKDKATQQAAFKGLNIDIVKEVAQNTGVHGVAINEIIDEFYSGGALNQIEEAVVANWDGAVPASDSHKFYRDVFAPTCRTCHISRPFGAPSFTSKADFHSAIANVQNRVCSQNIMPHAKRTSEIFWTSLDPNMPGFLELYGQTLPGWSALGSAQCGEEYVAGGNIVLSEFSSQIYPILFDQCVGCHGAVGNANFVIGNAEDTYDSILNATAIDGSSKYIVANNLGSSLLYQRIIQANPGRMPQGGADLEVTDTDTPPDGIFDAVEIANWINAGAAGP